MFFIQTNFSPCPQILNLILCESKLPPDLAITNAADAKRPQTLRQIHRTIKSPALRRNVRTSRRRRDCSGSLGGRSCSYFQLRQIPAICAFGTWSNFDGALLPRLMSSSLAHIHTHTHIHISNGLRILPATSFAAVLVLPANKQSKTQRTDRNSSMDSGSSSVSGLSLSLCFVS